MIPSAASPPISCGRSRLPAGITNLTWLHILPGADHILTHRHRAEHLNHSGSRLGILKHHDRIRIFGQHSPGVDQNRTAPDSS